MKTGVVPWIIMAVLAAVLWALPNVHGQSIWPQTPEGAAESFGVVGLRSAQADQWSPCDDWSEGQFVGCWLLSPDEPVTVTVPSWATLFDESGPHNGPDEFLEGSAVLRPNWSAMPTDTPTPTEEPTPEPTPTATATMTPTVGVQPIPQNPPLEEFPQTARIAADAFGVEGERSGKPGQWSPCDGWQPGQFHQCWWLAEGPVTPLSVPKGAWWEGWDGQQSVPRTIGPSTTEQVVEAVVRPQWSDIEPEPTLEPLPTPDPREVLLLPLITTN